MKTATTKYFRSKSVFQILRYTQRAWVSCRLARRSPCTQMSVLSSSTSRVAPNVISDLFVLRKSMIKILEYQRTVFLDTQMFTNIFTLPGEVLIPSTRRHAVKMYSDTVQHFRGKHCTVVFKIYRLHIYTHIYVCVITLAYRTIGSSSFSSTMVLWVSFMHSLLFWYIVLSSGPGQLCCFK
jgi:hypothetical protein